MDWRQCVEASERATATLSSPVVFVGHSGAGLLLPAIAQAAAPPVAG